MDAKFLAYGRWSGDVNCCSYSYSFSLLLSIARQWHDGGNIPMEDAVTSSALESVSSCAQSLGAACFKHWRNKWLPIWWLSDNQTNITWNTIFNPHRLQYRKVSVIERETVMYRLSGLAVVVVLMVLNVLDLKSGNRGLNSSSAFLKLCAS